MMKTGDMDFSGGRRTAIIGGGAAGFFLAVNLKEMCPQMHVVVMERGQRVLRKVAVSGGGRCNCTNTFEDVGDLQTVYPRGHRLMKRLLQGFSQRDAFEWFERRGVALTVQADHCVFPRSQDARTITDMLQAEARRAGVVVLTGTAVTTMDCLADYDYVCVTTGGQPRSDGLCWLDEPTEPPVPSLFTLSIADERLRQLMGTVAEHATAMLPGTKLRAAGALLITHWGLSGPCILRLSSYGARRLSETAYRHALSVNWLGLSMGATTDLLVQTMARHARRQVATAAPDGLQQRLWQYLAEKSLPAARVHAPWGSLNQKELNRMVNVLTNDTYLTDGRAPFRDEFVTCGGVSLSAVNPATLESKRHPGRFYAGEVLDVDGVTGGFNFQAAWTTAYTVARAIAVRSEE